MGILVGYASGNRFRVVYADGDDEWGVFKNGFKNLDLEDGGQRRLQWFDFRIDELKAIGNDGSGKKIEKSQSEGRPSKTKSNEDAQVPNRNNKGTPFWLQADPKRSIPTTTAFSAAFYACTKFDASKDEEWDERSLMSPRRPDRKPADDRGTAFEMSEKEKCTDVMVGKKTISPNRSKRLLEEVDGTHEALKVLKKKKKQNKVVWERFYPHWIVIKGPSRKGIFFECRNTNDPS